MKTFVGGIAENIVPERGLPVSVLPEPVARNRDGAVAEVEALSRANTMRAKTEREWSRAVTAFVICCRVLVSRCPRNRHGPKTVPAR